MINLLDLDTIQKRLNQEFSQCRFDIPGLRMTPSYLDDRRVSECEQDLGVKLPDRFRNLILKYSFCDLSLGGIFFGAGTDYVEILTRNNRDLEFPWWGTTETRPKDHLMIASTDGFIVLLDTRDETILAYQRGQHWMERRVIASDFDLFVRAAGTLFLDTSVQVAERARRAVSLLVGCDMASTFWKIYWVPNLATRKTTTSY
jgi:hypothetical protein